MKQAKPITLPFPDADSPDVTDEEIAAAVSIGNVDEMSAELDRLIHLSCASCGEAPMALAKMERRKRKPLEFSRVTLRCPQGHEVRKLFIRTWAQQA